MKESLLKQRHNAIAEREQQLLVELHRLSIHGQHMASAVDRVHSETGDCRALLATAYRMPFWRRRPTLCVLAARLESIERTLAEFAPPPQNAETPPETKQAAVVVPPAPPAVEGNGNATLPPQQSVGMHLKIVGEDQ